ncbi:MAG TPA: efflux transporter outer membrane subunit [Candidatus Angelobacter sp.]|jgi:NodT family efflux transporter outer membrane factor (OMF) lipoprotein|nr:efflux transporter outer membrane subunit [Candidatus Angelobacter sp.]
MKLTLSYFVLALLLGNIAAQAATKYKKPDVTIPANWQTPAPWHEASPLDSIPKGTWWTLFNDAELNQYEDRAMANNQTLKASVSRLAEARAAARVTASGLYPELDANPSASRQRISGNRPNLGSPIPTRPDTENTFTIPFTLNYEVDLFGRIRRSVEAANENLQASAADLENVRLMVSSELAADYFSLRELDAEGAVVQKAIDIQQKGLDLVNKRHTGGAVSGLDVAQQQTVLESSVAQVYLLKQQRAQFEHALAVLQGLPASQFQAPVRALDAQPPAVPLELPSELLQRRPDIAIAERQVAAANSEIGVARAAFYPSIPLIGGGGVESRNITSLFNAPSALWSIGFSALEPLFAGGRLHARLDLARASYDENVANYRESTLVGFQQVEDALSGLDALQSASQSQQRAVDAAERSLDLANSRYTGGLVTYLDVVTAETQALNNERLAAQIQGQRLVTSVLLVKALGGGWDSSSMASVGVVKPSLKQAVQQ